jgi:hypothetical protein
MKLGIAIVASFTAVSCAGSTPPMSPAGAPTQTMDETIMARNLRSANSPNACVDSGGRCVRAGACELGRGHLGTATCNLGEATECCFFGLDSCGGIEDFVCCAAGVASRPRCTGTRLVCASDEEQRVPMGACAP